MSDVGAAVSWWIEIQILGIAVWPLAFRLMRWLPDRGYTLAKPLGLLLASYSFWLLVSLGILPNTPGGMAIAVALIAALGWLPSLHLRSPTSGFTSSILPLLAKLREHRSLIVAYELLFVLALVAWTALRAHNPDIVSGEKQMEFAFFNAIGRSVSFPPHDPWLAGYALPYYYFGYVMMSLLARLPGVAAGTAFSLGNAMWFALSAASAFGLVANLILLSKRRAETSAIAFGLLGAVALVGMGNLEAPLEVARVAGWGTPQFWSALDIVDLNQPYVPPADGQPTWPPRSQWWWRASRVIHDYHPSSIGPRLAAVLGTQPDPNTHYQEMIDEFPQFTFLYGDMHPHVFNIPFVLLALGLTLNLYQAVVSGEARSLGWGRQGVPLWIAYPLAFGALGFLNAWDFPIYLMVGVSALSLGRYVVSGSTGAAERIGSRLWLSLRDLLVLGIGGVLLYYPFYSRFASPVSGLAPNVFHGTSLPQFFVMLGSFIVVGGLFGLKLLIDLSRSGEVHLPAFGLKAIGGGVAVTILATLATTTLGAIVFRAPGAIREWFESILGLMQQRGLAVEDHLLARLSDPWLVLWLATALAAIGLLWRARRARAAESPTIDFALLLFLIGALLAYTAEFVFVVDLLKTRANTVFKLYYQTWILWGVAAAYGAYALLSGPARIESRLVRFAAAGAIAAMFGAGLMYPALAIPTKIGEPAAQPALDAQLAAARSLNEPGVAEAYAAVQWLNQNVPGAPIILEAADGAYTYEPDKSRISSWTGLPTLLGWYWHEVQWRGNEDVPRQRLPEVEAIYATPDPAAALSRLRHYGVSYVYVGPRERRLYPAEGLAKFDDLLPVVFQQGDVTIYRVP